MISITLEVFSLIMLLQTLNNQSSLKVKEETECLLGTAEVEVELEELTFKADSNRCKLNRVTNRDRHLHS